MACITAFHQKPACKQYQQVQRDSDCSRNSSQTKL